MIRLISTVWTFVLAALVTAFLVGCGEMSRGSSGADTADKSGGEKDDDELDDDERLELEIERDDLVVEYTQARFEEERLKFENLHEDRRAQVKAVEAERERDEAKKKLDEFLATGKADRLARSALSLDRSRDWLHQSEQELKELEAMYAAEEFATMTKELVLHRGRKQVEFAKRDLELAEKEATRLRDEELPREERELQRAAEKAHNTWIDANEDYERERMGRALGLYKAFQEIESLRRKIRRLDKKLGGPPTNLGLPDPPPGSRLVNPLPPGLMPLPGMAEDGSPLPLPTDPTHMPPPGDPSPPPADGR